MATLEATHAPGARAARALRSALTAPAVVAAAISLVVAFRELGFYRSSLSVPIRYANVDDTKFYLALVKGLIEHGSWTTNPSLGFPFGQHLYDFPQGADNLNLLLIRALGVFSSNPAEVANLFLLLTFPLAAVSAVLVLRRLGVSGPVAVMAAVIFSLLPYHFDHESQLLLTAYYAVPLAVYLFLRIVGGEPVFARGRRGWLTGRTAASVLLCAVIGSAGLYYATFSALLIVAGSAIVALKRHRAAAVVPGVLVAAAIAALITLNLAPTLAYRAAHGPNPQLERTPQDTRDLGLQLAGLVLPVRDHRLAPLHGLNQRFFDPRGTPSYCEPCSETLGTVGDVGFAWLVILALVGVVGAGALRSSALERRAALGVALTLLIATVGGLSGLASLVATTDIRAWNRMSLYIAFLSLLAAALLVERGGRRLARRRAPRLALPAIAGVLLVLGVADETSRFYAPPWIPTRREWQSDATFVRTIEARMPRGAAIFELPQVPFPEGYNEPAYGGNVYVGGFNTSYELMRGYLHSRTLRWSYGAMKGRRDDWVSQLTSQPIGFVLKAAADDGFSGVWIDLRGYQRDWRVALVKRVERVTRTRALISHRRDLVFLDLRPLRAELARTQRGADLATLRYDTLHPLHVRCTQTGLELTNPSHHPRPAELSFQLAGVGDDEPVVVRFPDGHVERALPPADGAWLVAKRLVLPPGRERVRFAFAGPAQMPHLLVDGPSEYMVNLNDSALSRFGLAPFSTDLMAGVSAPPCTQTVLAVRQRPALSAP